MERHRSPWLLLLLAAALLLPGCGPLGMVPIVWGLYEATDTEDEEPPADPGPDVIPVGWIGDGCDGWQTGVVSSDMYRMNRPQDVFVDDAGDLYVADTYHHRIVKWSSTGGLPRWIGGGSNGWHFSGRSSRGSSLTHFSYPSAVWVDGDGYIFVADYMNDRVCKWNASGTALGWIGGGTDGWQAGDAPSSGTGPREFFMPAGLVLDDTGTLFVADTSNHRISRWTAGGVFDGWIGSGLSGWQMSGAASVGVTYRHFYYPCDLALDGTGDLLVADSANHRISKWSSAGAALGYVGGGLTGWVTTGATPLGSDEGSFQNPHSLCIDGSGTIFVSDRLNHRVSRWSSAGSPMGWVGGGSSGWQHTSGASEGTGASSFHDNWGLCLDGSGSFYVADYLNHRVCKWSPGGVAQGWIGDGGYGWQTEDVTHLGFNHKSFTLPSDVCIDASGNVYVTDFSNHRVCKWGPDGVSQGWMGGGTDGWQTGLAPGLSSTESSFYSPFGVCTDGTYLYVSDLGNHRISRWSLGATPQGWIGGGTDGWQSGTGAASGTDLRSFENPTGVCIAGGLLYVSDQYNHRISIWDASTGAAQGWIGDGTDGLQSGAGAASGTDFQNFRYPSHLAVDAGGTIFVADNSNCRIARWSSSYQAEGWLGNGVDGYHVYPGSLPGYDYPQFFYPKGVCLDSSGRLFVADTSNHRLCLWDAATGEARGWVGSDRDRWTTEGTASSGAGLRYFNKPTGLCLDAAGCLYVADRENHRICCWRLAGGG